ncbi:hypothetical protein FNF31_02240 [Cafeteria roenbergensis]|uniref:Flavin reductase like domain-containing protein n=1 Tax=Cafeteria roenbergensis TaxID=33653 RepID=A0A5A8DH94_CAFRO|nr:hypothetical protein FNF31_02240 [Cafeteria roenbergensis]KAA0169152.1 hypothetical protein FNF28_02278 [Cafeteria roenbergensis]
MAAAAGGEAVCDVLHVAARLLYPNPVCLLGTVGPGGIPNFMTVSWLTCIDNDGSVFLSVNERRCSAANLLASRRLCLSVAVDGMQSLLVAVGSCHGAQEGLPKSEALGIDCCLPGWAGEWAAEGGPPAAVCGAAHVVVEVASVDTQAGHHRIVGTIAGAWVRRSMWAGRTYAVAAEGGHSDASELCGSPHDEAADAQPRGLLTFLGSRRFGVVRPAAAPRKPGSDKRA